MSVAWKLIRFSARPAGSRSGASRPGISVRLASRQVQRGKRRLYRDERVQQPEDGQPGERLRREDSGYASLAEAADEDELAPVHGVDERGAEQAGRQRRPQRGQADSANGERRPGDVVDLQRDREPGQRAANGGQQAAGEQPAERCRLAQRGYVGEQPRHGRPSPADGWRRVRR